MTGVRIAAWTGIACPPLVTAVLLVAGRLSPSYDPLRTTVSHLGQRGAPFALEVNLSLAALGLTVVAVAWALGRSLGPPAAAGAGLLALAGVALVGVALLSRDPARPVAHRTVALVFFLSLAVAPLLVARRLRGEPGWSRHAGLSLATAAVSFALLVVGVAGVVHGGLPAGAWERAFVAVNLLWLTLVAARLLRRPLAMDEA
jgi:hypothetical membrane protein